MSIEDTRTGQVETRLVENASRSYHEGVIGFAEGCDVRLAAPGFAAHHVRWYAGGHHRFLEVLDEEAVMSASEGEDYRRGDYLRIDYQAFRAGSYSLGL